ncbi:MAG: hypothetical protein GXY49_04505 [Syntrophomonadaceae bacterium]|nr:hypothetical protein [Syntrophomonadaceae bacterium]
MNANRLMIVIIITLIVSASLAVFINRGENNINTAKKESYNYLVSLNGKIGIYNIKKQTFESLYDDIYVSQIIGITNNKEIVVINALPEKGVEGGSFQHPQKIYIVDLNNKSSRCLAKNFSKAYFSPDRGYVAYITFPNGGLEYINLRTITTTHIAESVGSFGLDNIWSPDSTKLAIANADSGRISIYNMLTKQYDQCLSLNDRNAIYLGWFDKSHLLIKVPEANRQYIAFYNINSKKIKYLFNKESDIYNAVCTKNSIIGFKINPQDPRKWNIVISPKTIPDSVSNLLSIPSGLDQASKGERPFMFVSQYTPISDSKMFYRLLESETYQPLYCGIIDVDAHTTIEIDKAITSLFELDSRQ